MKQEEIADWFAYRAPSAEQVATMALWRAEMTKLAADFVAHTPSCADQTVALRKLKEALMAMNQALVAPSPPRGR